MKFFDLEILGLAGGNNRAVQHTVTEQGHCATTTYTTGTTWIGCKTGWGKGIRRIHRFAPQYSACNMSSVS